MTQIPRPIRIGVQVANQHAQYSAIRGVVAELEDLGVDIIFNWDHFFPLSGDRDGSHFEAWTMLGAWAEQTSRVEFGTLVNCNSYRNANLQADMARTLDHISGGRFIFGTGSGWFQRDYDEYGLEFGTPGSRLRDLAAAMPVIKDRWQRLNPPPSRQIPILIGGAGEMRTLRIVAEHADIWHSFSSPDVLTHKLEVLRGHGAALGRNVDEIEISVEVKRRSTDEADALRNLGASLFTLGLSAPNFDLDLVRKWLAWRDSRNAG